MLSNPEIEMSLVATALAVPRHWHELSFVRGEDFTDQLAGAVWEEIRNFLNDGRTPDPTTLSLSIYQTPEDQKQCRSTLAEWIAENISTINGPDYAALVKDLADRRRLKEAAQNILDLANDTSCGMNAAEISSRGVSQITQGQLDCLDFIPAYQVSEKIINNLSNITPCFSTGLKRFDEALGGGFYQNRFYGIGARMKAGKSLFMSTIAYNMAVNGGARVLYLCLEMGSEESMQRIMSMHMGINSLKFLKPDIRSQSWFRARAIEAKECLKTSGLFFRTRPRMTLDDLKATVARAGMSGKIDGIIVDYLQLVEGKRKDQSSAEHYDNVAQTLAEAVKRHPIWILSAAQLNKEGSIRGSEGLLMACDLAVSLNKKDGECYGDGTRVPDRAWIETMVSRYTPYTDIGTEEVPGYEIDVQSGPRFIEL